MEKGAREIIGSFETNIEKKPISHTVEISLQAGVDVAIIDKRFMIIPKTEDRKWCGYDILRQKGAKVVLARYADEERVGEVPTENIDTDHFKRTSILTEDESNPVYLLCGPKMIYEITYRGKDPDWEGPGQQMVFQVRSLSNYEPHVQILTGHVHLKEVLKNTFLTGRRNRINNPDQ